MNIAKILNNDDEKRTREEKDNSRPGSPEKRPRNSPEPDNKPTTQPDQQPKPPSVTPTRAMSTPSQYDSINEPILHRKSKSIPLDGPTQVTTTDQGITVPIASASGSEIEGSDRKGKSKRSKAKNSTWTIEDDRKLVDLVMSTLPTQDFAEYARILNKRDAQTVRYRWKVILRRAKGEGM